MELSHRVQRARKREDLYWLRDEARSAANAYKVAPTGETLARFLLSQRLCYSFLQERAVLLRDYGVDEKDLKLIADSSDEGQTLRQIAVLDIDIDRPRALGAPSLALREDPSLAALCCEYILLFRTGHMEDYELMIERANKLVKVFPWRVGASLQMRHEAVTSIYARGGPVEKGLESLRLGAELRRRYPTNKTLMETVAACDTYVRAKLKKDPRFKGKLP